MRTVLYALRTPWPLTELEEQLGAAGGQGDRQAARLAAIPLGPLGDQAAADPNEELVGVADV